MSQSTERSPSGPLVAPNDGDARHPVWSVYRPILEHQLLELRNLTNPRLRASMDVDTLATYVIRNLTQGWDQKTLRRWLYPPTVCRPQHDAVIESLASWVFATQGVLSHIYQPVLSLHGVAAVVTDRDIPNWGPPVSQHSILFRLPNELFDKVIEYLPGQDVNDVRLTCRESRHKSFDFWSKRFFTKRQFMIDQYSLQTLLDISRHPELHSILTHLVIGVDEINTKDTLSFLLGMHSTSPMRVATIFQYWRDAAAAQQALLQTGKAIELLSQAMSNLTELKTVSVSGSIISQFLPSAHTFYYPHLGMRSYGASAYQLQRRNVSDVEANSKGFPDSVFSCVFNSLVRSSPEKLRALQTNIDRHRNRPHLNDEAFYLPPFAPFITENLTFLANLTELHLDVNLESRSISRIRRTADHRHTFDPENISLRQLLCSCYSLVTLNLSVGCASDSRYHCDFTAWLVGTANNPSVDNPVYWPFLRRLVLKGLYMSPATLRSIFLKFDTIESAVLEDITLRDCFIDHPSIPHHSQEQRENHWATFFSSCGSATVLSNLKSLELDQLTVQRYREDPDDDVAIWDKDFERILFLLEAQYFDAGYLETFTVTDFRPEALETLAEQIWFIGDWDRAKDAANAADAEEAAA